MLHHSRKARAYFLRATFSLALAAVLSGLMQLAIRHYIETRHFELAADGKSMLWFPWLLVAAAVCFFGRGMVLTILGARAQARGTIVQPHWRRGPQNPYSSRRFTQPIHQHAPDPYRQACTLLGVLPGSSWAEIRACWRRQLPHWHPDRGGDLHLWHLRLAAYQHLEAREDARRFHYQEPATRQWA